MLVVTWILVYRSQVLLHIAEDGHVFFRLLREEDLRRPSAVAERGVPRLTLRRHLLLDVLEVVALGDSSLPWLVHPYDHISRDLARHPVNIILRAVVVDQLNLIRHLILIAVNHRISDVLSLVAERHQRLHHLLIVLGVAFWVGRVLELLARGHNSTVVVRAGDTWS